MKLTQYLSIFAISAMLASCSKEGPVGPAGANGANGVTNITASYYTVYANSWTFSNNEWYYNTGQVVPDGDGVMVYESLSGTGYQPLPASGVFAPSDYLTYVYGSSGGLTLWYSNASNTPNVSVDIEVVDFPPAINVKYPNVDWKNYAQVSALPEFQAALVKTK